MGFETYQKILQEAIDELKENEFKSLYTENENDSFNAYSKEVQIDTDLEIYIPDYYVNIVKERLALYQELSQLKTKEELNAFEEELKDRFGTLPKEAQELLESVELKWIATTLGIERIILKKELFVLLYSRSAK